MKFSVKYPLAVAFLLSAGAFSAQVAEVATEESFKTVEEISAIDFLMKGGVFLIPIVLLLFYTTYVAVERFLYIRRMTKQNAMLISEVYSKLNNTDVKGAIDAAQREQTAFGTVLKEGVESIGQPVPQIEANMEKVANIEIGKMEKNINHLGLIAGKAPLGFYKTNQLNRWQ